MAIRGGLRAAWVPLPSRPMVRGRTTASSAIAGCDARSPRLHRVLRMVPSSRPSLPAYRDVVAHARFPTSCSNARVQPRRRSDEFKLRGDRSVYARTAAVPGVYGSSSRDLAECSAICQRSLVHADENCARSSAKTNSAIRRLRGACAIARLFVNASAAPRPAPGRKTCP